MENITAKDIDSLHLFHKCLLSFVKCCLDIWPECEATKKYVFTLEAITDKSPLITEVAKKWHKEMDVVCWTSDADDEPKNLYDAVDSNLTHPFITCEISILKKFNFKQKLNDINSNPNKKEVQEDIDNMLKHIRNINMYSRMLFVFDSDVRSVINQVTMETAQKMQRGEKVDLRPIKLGERIVNQISKDKGKQDDVINGIVDNFKYIAPVLKNMQKESGCQESCAMPDLEEMMD